MKDNLSNLVRTSQLIVAALASGVLVFLAVLLFGLRAGLKPLDPQAIPSLVMLAFAIVCVLARFVVPGLMVRSAIQNIARGTWKPSSNQANMPVPDTDEGKLAAVYLTKTILGSALLEGGALANLVIYMVEGQVYSLVLGVVLALGILAAFPTRDRFEHWLERQLRSLQEVRDLGRFS